MSVIADPPPSRDAESGRFRWRLGLHPLDLDDWIEWGTDAEAVIAEKRRISAAHHDTVFAAIDDIHDEAVEVAEALVTHLVCRFPDHLASVELDPALHPLEAAGRLVPEDLVLLVERDGGLVVGGGTVCFPNRWDLRSKLGQTLGEVHAPVPRLNVQLGSHLDRFLAHLEPARSFWRVGWGIIDTADWYTPPSAGPASLPPALDDLHLRVERETFRRFPRTGCVLFTLRTRVTPLSAVTDGAALAAAIDALPGDVRQYKQLAAIGDEVISKLRGAPSRS